MTSRYYEIKANCRKTPPVFYILEYQFIKKLIVFLKESFMTPMDTWHQTPTTRTPVKVVLSVYYLESEDFSGDLLDLGI